jgi:hypothetical protein
MKVSELIEILEQLNGELEVIRTDMDGYDQPVTGVNLHIGTSGSVQVEVE